nr:zinc knuckle CX2CX4HX4C [Tanacetum cinerariifolium]
METNREAHDKIIQGLEMKVKTLINDVEGRANGGNFKECMAICTEDGLPLYTPFYYSPEEIEYFSANSRFFDKERQETNKSGMRKALAALEATHEIKKVPQEEKLDFNNALADLGASINVMPLSMYKCLGIGKLEPINMVIKMADNTKCTPKGIVKNLLIKIDKFIFSVDFVILDMVEDFMAPIILGRPLLATAHTKVDIFRKSISLEVGNEKDIQMRSSFTTSTFESVRSIKSETCPEDDDFKKIDYDLFLYDSESCDFKRLLGINLNIFSYEINIHESYEEIVYKITEVDKETYSTPKEKSDDEGDLEGILDYLKPRSYDGLIDLDNEAYNKRRCRLLGLTFEDPPLILIKKANVTRYTIGIEEIYTKVKVLGFDEMPRTRDNVASIRARLMEKMANKGSG